MLQTHPTTTEWITEEIASGIQILTLNRPEKKNAMTVDMYQALSDALHRAELDDTVQVSILTGKGPDFSAGNDINEFLEIANAPEKMASIMSFLQAITTYKKPLFAAVEGRAVGVAATILLHCDMVFTARDTQLIFPFVQLGLVPEAASSYLLPKLVGHQKAFEILMLGDPVLAQEAQQLGLVNHLCESGETLHLAQTYAERLATLPNEAVMLSKELLKCRTLDDIQMALMREGRIFKDRLKSPEAKSKFEHFLNR
ncbi:enoyl-CoA hydratase-related protein [Marinomonas ostreistagni]|uniref:enoyl-CoA hydratase-related protein n=1 Tax=Marinomonas ostreistagni TaxID=359209 RepID=UPI00194FF1C5|nr:enoyl-CoA hydratase-related protein [Marinomonas ostreistagni]MBM6551787.1 enoyl-CoA hydratase/isomerase family protein [Marinomonas ostreistagni]